MKRALSFLVFLLLVACAKDDPIVTDIMLDTTALSLKVGETHQFKATHTPPEAPAPTYSWEVSQNFSVVDGSNYFNGDIDQTGLFTAKIVGSTFVTVRTKDAINPLTGKPFEVSCQVKVLPISVESLTLNHTNLTMSVGDTARLVCTVFPENATEQRINWTNNRTDIVDYQIQTDGSCIIQAKKKGEATIKAISRDQQTEVVCKIVVNPAKLEKIEFDVTEKSIIKGDSFKIKPIFTPSFAENTKITWSTSDDQIAKVNDQGVVYALNVGKCIIKAVSSEGELEASCSVTVKPAPLLNIQFDKEDYYIEIDGTKQLKLVYTPETAENKKVKWSSSDSQIASIDDNGLVTAKAKGTAKITAVSEDGNHKASCIIHVVDIDQMMKITFPSMSVTILNGYYYASMICSIKNNSSKTVKLIRFSVVETGTERIVVQTEDTDVLGEELQSGDETRLQVTIRNVYEPICKWDFEVDGKQYSVISAIKNTAGLKADNSTKISLSDQPMVSVTRAKK